MIPLPVIFAAVAAVAGFTCAWTYQEARYGKQIQTIENTYLKRDFRALENAHADTLRLQALKDAALKNASARHAAMARAAADSRVALVRVQDNATAAMRVINYSHGAAIAVGTAYRDVYTECSKLLVEVGQASDGHASDVRTLIESWPVR